MQRPNLSRKLAFRTPGLVACSLWGGLWGCGGPQGESRPPLPPPLPACSAAIADGVVITTNLNGSAGALQSTLCMAKHPEDTAPPAGELDPAPEVGGALKVDGFVVVSPPVGLRLAQPVGRRGLDLTIPITMTLPMPNWDRRLVVLARFGNAPAQVALVENPSFAAGSETTSTALRFHLPGHGIAPNTPTGTMGEVAVFQLAVPADAGTRVKRRFSYRAIGGISMGGIGSSMQFFRHPDRYDAIGVLGADPGPDLTYTQGFIRDYFFGGFCTAESGMVGKDCPTERKPLAGQGEISGSFDVLPIQRGEGIGLTLRRSLYMRANRDLVRALGNWAYYNPVDAYLPPGVPETVLGQKPEVACMTPVIFKGTVSEPTGKPFYDGRFNPKGEHDVITFCDGGEPTDMPGVYDDSKPQRDPTQILLAVDVNRNGRRDKGEPVILQQGEPFRDYGPDGLPSSKEPGYDPIRNPDPAGDDYHYLKNPNGTEANWRYDAGEPYDDAGLDGVRGKGCPIDSAMPGCFDYGEGNGKYDLNPGLKRWLDHDPHTLVERLGRGPLVDKDIYYDAGIRDFFNAHVSTSTLFGTLAAQRMGGQTFAGFPALSGLAPTEELRFDPSTVDLARLGSRVYVRYGNPEVSEAMAMMTGDGRHAGSVTQVVQRAVVLFSFLLTRWPDADVSMQPSDDPRLTPKDQKLVMKNGRETPYSIILPPGYFEEANAKLRYPIVYIGHGYGMDPTDIGKSIGSLIHRFMSDPDPMRRLPKAVLVFIDGVCRPGGEVPNAPLSTMGDLCEEGTFYTNHPTGTYKGEDFLEELDTYLRKTYRLREPAEVEVYR